MDLAKISPSHFDCKLYRVKLNFGYGYCFVKIIKSQFRVLIVRVLSEFLEIDEPEIFRIEDLRQSRMLTHDLLTFEYPNSPEWTEIEGYVSVESDYYFPDLKKSSQYIPPLTEASFTRDPDLNWYLVREFNERKTKQSKYEFVKHLGVGEAWDLDTVRQTLTALWHKYHDYPADDIIKIYGEELLEENLSYEFALDLAIKAPLYFNLTVEEKYWNKALSYD
ncbi:MAG: hypothetical protein AAFO96_26890 [Bacteroidota bacterium]